MHTHTHTHTYIYIYIYSFSVTSSVLAVTCGLDDDWTAANDVSREDTYDVTGESVTMTCHFLRQ